MTFSRALSIMLTVALFNLLRVYWAKYQAWKANRSEVTAYRNWRGVYVPDLRLKRLERSILWAWILFTLFAFCFTMLTMVPELAERLGLN